jgi:anaerobic selenocysteine-containing dehydrogenase
MVWISNGNPVAMLPESNTVADALRSREFTVVVDGFMTDTARCADLVLPTTTMLEDEDLVGAYGHHYLGNVRPVVAPPDGVKTDYEIIQQLAARVGLNGDFSISARDWKRRFLGPVESLGVSLESLERKPVRNPLAPRVLFADRKFPTASGKANLIRHVEPNPVLPTAERPLLLLAGSTEKAQGSQWRSDRQQGPPLLTVHPAAATGFTAGQLAVVESETGSLRVRLAFDDRQRRDMALMVKGGWLQRGRCANVLVEAKTTDAGGGAVYYDTAVRLLPDRKNGLD